MSATYPASVFTPVQLSTSIVYVHTLTVVGRDFHWVVGYDVSGYRVAGHDEPSASVGGASVVF